MDLNKLFKQNKSVEVNEVEDNTIILDENFKNVFIMDNIGSSIWNLFSEEITIKAAKEKIEEFYMDFNECEFYEFIDALIENQLLVSCDVI